MQIFVKLLLTTYQLILDYQKWNYLRGYSQKDFLVDFLVNFLGPLPKTGLPLMKGVIQPLAKSALTSLGLIPAASAADAGIHKKIGSDHNTTIISNDEMEDLE